MKPKMFEELLESVREGGAILRGQRKASRRFEVGSSGIRAANGREREDLAELGTGPTPPHRAGGRPLEDHRARATSGRESDSSGVSLAPQIWDVFPRQ